MELISSSFQAKGASAAGNPNQKQILESIYKKTRDGVKTLRAMSQVEYNKDGTFYNRTQEYELFISRMMELYNAKQPSSKETSAGNLEIVIRSQNYDDLQYN